MKPKQKKSKKFDTRSIPASITVSKEEVEAARMKPVEFLKKLIDEKTKQYEKFYADLKKKFERYLIATLNCRVFHEEEN